VLVAVLVVLHKLAAQLVCHTQDLATLQSGDMKPSGPPPALFLIRIVANVERYGTDAMAAAVTLLHSPQILGSTLILISVIIMI
jgi:hypothetical protein